MTQINIVKLLLVVGEARSKIMILRNKKKSTKNLIKKNTDAESHNLITSFIYKKARKGNGSGFTLPWSEPTPINFYNSSDLANPDKTYSMIKTHF